MPAPGGTKETAIDGSHADRRDLVRFIVSRLGCRATAEDLVQEAYIRLLQVTQPLRSPRAFLFRTVTNLVLNHRRDERRRAELRREVVEPQMNALDVSTPEQAVVAAGELRILADAFVELPARTREVFLLNRFEDLNQREVAERLGISLTVVERHMSRAVLHLATALAAASSPVMPLPAVSPAASPVKPLPAAPSLSASPVMPLPAVPSLSASAPDRVGKDVGSSVVTDGMVDASTTGRGPR